MKDILPMYTAKLVEKEYAWIAFAKDRQGNIADVRVYDLSHGVHITGLIDKWLYDETEYLLGDFGCCLSEWHNWQLKDCLFKLGFQYPMVSHEVRVRAIKELGRIIPWVDDVDVYLKYMAIDDRGEE